MKKGNNSSSAEIYCSRCKMRVAFFECPECTPFKYFCDSCDEYVHAMSSKRTHSRKVLEKCNKNPETTHDSYYRSVKKSKDFELVNMNSATGGFYNDKELNFNYNLGSTYHSKCATRGQDQGHFIENPKMFHVEKDEFSNKLFPLERQTENTIYSLNEKISQLQNEIRENQNKSNSEIRSIKESHYEEMNRLTHDMESEMNFLVNKNRELERCNEDYLRKLNEKTNEASFIKQNLNEKFGLSEIERKRSEEEVKSIKVFYEKRIKFINDSFAEEKAKLISGFEMNNDRLNSGYKVSKDKYLSIIDSLQKDYKDLSKNSKIEEDKLNLTVESLRNEIGRIKSENSLLSQAIHGLRTDVGALKENLDKSKKESNFYMKEFEKKERENSELFKESENIKMKYEKLHEITHGKFKKK